MGLEAAAVDLFIAKGYTTTARLAFNCNFAPGAASDRPFVDMVQETWEQSPMLWSQLTTCGASTGLPMTFS